MKRVVQILADSPWAPYRAVFRTALAVASSGSSSSEELGRQRELVISAMAEIDAAKDAIEAQLADARRIAASTGEYSDRSWYQSCENAGRAYSRLRQEAQRILGKIKLRQAELDVAREEAQAEGAEIDIAKVRELWRALGRALGELP